MIWRREQKKCAPYPSPGIGTEVDFGWVCVTQVSTFGPIKTKPCTLFQDQDNILSITKLWLVFQYTPLMLYALFQIQMPCLSLGFSTSADNTVLKLHNSSEPTQPHPIINNDISFKGILVENLRVSPSKNYPCERVDLNGSKNWAFPRPFDIQDK